MKIHVDTFVTKGYSHYKCEDYATQIETDDYCAVIISDGCSSSENTDVGAAIMALTAKKNMDFIYAHYKNSLIGNYNLYNDINNKPNVVHKIATLSQNFAKEIGLNDNAIDATLLILIYDKIEDTIAIYQFGDGNRITEQVDSIEWINNEYTNNRPFYPSYYADLERLERYFDVCRKEESICVLKSLTFYRDDSKEQCYDEHNCAFDHQVITHRPRGKSRNMLIASDGLTTFSKKENGKTILYDSQKLIKKILDFKGYNGQFLQRRMNKVLKECRSEGYDNFDDVSIGIISIEE